MTAVREQSANPPPRVVVRTFWKLHRAAYRITGGRFGLSRPAEGSKFGMLRLATVGRRSGRARVTIVGYFEDGSNLVTLAMNGWGEADPAWWLNLQARPETIVGLPDGPRAVRARIATGEERQRLWAKFRDYPGWGEDLDALAARRSRETAVVVLEPRSAVRIDETVAGDRDTAPSDAGTSSTNAHARGGHRPDERRRRLHLRHLWLVPGLAVAVYAGTLAEKHGVGLVPLLLFGIAPHLPVLLGFGQPHARGQMALRAVPLFNAMHHPAPALGLLGVAAVGVLPPFWLVGALAWLGHIVVGWGLGDGLRTSDGYPRRTAQIGRRQPRGSAAATTSAGSPA